MGTIGKILAENVITLRKERGFTQETLADLASLSVTGIAMVETQRTWPSKKTIEVIAKALGVPEERLFANPDYIPEPSIAQALTKVCLDLGFQAPKPMRRKGKKVSAK